MPLLLLLPLSLPGKMQKLPDAVSSLSAAIKSEPNDVRPPVPSSMHVDVDGKDDDDPIIRTIDVFVSPALSNTLHLLQYPLHPAATSSNSYHTPSEARLRPVHNMLELDYPVHPSAQAGVQQLPDKMCLSQRTFTSNAVAPLTHMALGKLNRTGTRLNVVPLQKHVLQMRPSFRHLNPEDDEPGGTAASESHAELEKNGGRQRPIMYQKKETERSIAAKRSSYAYQRASEEAEDWVELDVHGRRTRQWSPARQDAMLKVKCQDRDVVLRPARNPTSQEEDGGYVKSLNYLDSLVARGGAGGSGETFVENLSEWAPSTLNALNEDKTPEKDNVDHGIDMEETTASPSVGAAEQATAELAAKLAILLQHGNGTPIPYRVLRARFHPNKVPDRMLTVALSSVAVLVRGNFSLRSHLAKFLHLAGGEEQKRTLMDLRDVILLLLNMHGAVQRERLTRACSAMAAQGARGYKAVTADTVAFVLGTVARKSPHGMCWVAKVEDDEGFAAEFPEVGACHGVYWTKKKEMLLALLGFYENAEAEVPEEAHDHDISV